MHVLFFCALDWHADFLVPHGDQSDPQEWSQHHERTGNADHDSSSRSVPEAGSSNSTSSAVACGIHRAAVAIIIAIAGDFARNAQTLQQAPKNPNNAPLSRQSRSVSSSRQHADSMLVSQPAAEVGSELALWHSRRALLLEDAVTQMEHVSSASQAEIVSVHASTTLSAVTASSSVVPSSAVVVVPSVVYPVTRASVSSEDVVAPARCTRYVVVVVVFIARRKSGTPDAKTRRNPVMTMTVMVIVSYCRHSSRTLRAYYTKASARYCIRVDIKSGLTLVVARRLTRADKNYQQRVETDNDDGDCLLL